MSYDIIEKLKQAIDAYEDNAKWRAVGEIIQVGDGVIRVSGLREARSQEILMIETPKGEIPALALNLEEETIGALVLGPDDLVTAGARVVASGQVLSLEVGEEMIGRVVDPLGNPLDGLGEIFSKKQKPERYFLERKAPGVLDREPVMTPLHTGLKSIDAMIPIGRGQRELIIGDRQTGKSAIAIDTILNQAQDPARPPVICIYVAIGQKESKVARLVQVLKERGALAYTIVVSATSASPAAFQFLAPYAGAAIGEYFMDQGRDALVVYDDLSKHAWAYRQISLLLQRPPGREAYPGDVFYLHSRLLERAAKMSKQKGGGSLTALPIIETQLGDISAYVPTNVISITDGQIYLESDLFYQGVRPAVNVGLSVSRVGGSAQTKAMKKIAGKLRLDLAQFRELQAFVQFSSDMDDTTRAKIRRGQVLVELLKQSDLSPLDIGKEIVLLYAGLNGYLDNVPLTEIGRTQAKLLEQVEVSLNENVLDPIRRTGEFTEGTETALRKMLDNFDFAK